MNHFTSFGIAAALALVGLAAFTARDKDASPIAVPALLKLYTDERPGAYTLVARHASPIETDELVLNLETVESVSPKDLMHALFGAAKAMREEQRSFELVRLSRAGIAVYELSGYDFREIGRMTAEGENPVYMMRTLPEKLKRPSGGPAFDTWTGGEIGVLTQQMKDVATFGTTWAGF